MTLVSGKDAPAATVAPNDIFGPQHQSPDMNGYYANSLSPEPASSVSPDDPAFTDSRRTSISLGSSDFDDYHQPLPPPVSAPYDCTPVPHGFENSFHHQGVDQIGFMENRFLQSTPLRARLYHQHSTQYLDNSGPSDHGGSSYQYSPYTPLLPSFSASQEMPNAGHPRGPSPLSSGNSPYPNNQLHSGMSQFPSQSDHSCGLFAESELLHRSPDRHCAVLSSTVEQSHLPNQPYTYHPSSFGALAYPAEPLSHPVFTAPHPGFVGVSSSFSTINGTENWAPQLGHVHRQPQQQAVASHRRLDSGSGSSSRPVQNLSASVRAPRSGYQRPPSPVQLPRQSLKVRARKARSSLAQASALSSPSKSLGPFDPTCVLPAISPYEINRASSWTAHFEALGRKGRKKKKRYHRKGRNSDTLKENLLSSPKSEVAVLHQCPLCPRKFERRNGLAIHLKWHYKPRGCRFQVYLQMNMC